MVGTQSALREPEPRISTRLLDSPSQRLYYLSFGLLCQAIKLFDFLRYLTTSSDATPAYGRKWVFFDLCYCLLLRYLRIPRLRYSKAVVLLQILSLCFVDGIIFGGIKLDILQRPDHARSAFNGMLKDGQDLVATTRSHGFTDFDEDANFGFLSLSSAGGKDDHLSGQHTVRMSPVSTAQLNPGGHSFCLASPTSSVIIPILLNNTIPSGISYTLHPLGSSTSGIVAKVERFELSARDLRAIEQSRADALQLTRVVSPPQDEYEYDDDDDEDSEEAVSQRNLQKTQGMAHIKVSKPGVLRIERIKDTSNVDARLGISRDLIVAPCPSAQFVSTSPSRDTYCAGGAPDVTLSIDVFGVPPLSLRWSRTRNGHKESFVVEGIEGDHDDTATKPGPNDNTARLATSRRPQNMRVPLTASLDSFGTLVWTLEEVTDGVGNVIRLDKSASKDVQSSTVRSLTVLHRPSVSFQHCRLERPRALQIGSETPLVIAATQADALDAPWEVRLQYSPPADWEVENKANKLHPWVKTLRTSDNEREVKFSATAPGDYKILGVKGKRCEGDVMAPDMCTVVEQPRPTAEVEWRRIHECSGDTGVSASIILHGTPPFHLYYRMQRDKEPAREESKVFNSLRGELSLQPDREGAYTYSFSHISDSNYQRVPLSGPTIDQVVHPLALAELVRPNRSGRISSCEGDTVDVDVALKGSGPWNVQLQVVGPRGSKLINVPSISETRKTVSVPIPSDVNKKGGSFEIDLVHVEDSNGCKRAISVPSISVDVKRIKPSARFYSHNGHKAVTVLENAQTFLPLRLTGDGPWDVKFTKQGSNQVMSKKVTSPNDHLAVSEKGVYELISVHDAQCPGSIVPDHSTYEVDWIPRPHAKLSSTVVSSYEPYNGSYILPPVCEGLEDHVDLDLTGSPPFQIMYNIARGNDAGGTLLLDQPTFTSIQPRTRFQLLSASPGRYYYEVKQIGDMVYPLAQHKDAIIPRSQRLLFEQQVLRRPSTRFKSRQRVQRCFGDTFTPRDPASDAQVILEGTAPFHLRLSVKNFVTSHVEFVELDVEDSLWTIDLPQYEFRSVGTYLVTIESVQDASKCTAAAIDPLASTIWVDVSETAAISPLDHKTDYCVGDVSHFQLEGTPAWQIGYRINGKSHTREAKSSPFSIAQQQPGEFTITSISHQQKLCKAVVTDLTLNIHPLPSAQVGHGKRIYQDIHEGDSVEILFTLIGEPPFTFTYQRSEPVTKKGGKAGKVLETHTVSRVNTREYSIFSALEGTWTVTSISDRYCRYPPAQTDGDKFK